MATKSTTLQYPLFADTNNYEIYGSTYPWFVNTNNYEIYATVLYQPQCCNPWFAYFVFRGKTSWKN